MSKRTKNDYFFESLRLRGTFFKNRTKSKIEKKIFAFHIFDFIVFR
jgi:hypothetical protein